MNTDPNPEQKQESQKLTMMIIERLVRGQKPAAIVKILKKQGVSEADAQAIVNAAQQKLEEFKKTPEWRKIQAEKYRSQMLRGLIWTVAGIILTAASYILAIGGSFGGSYLLCWGAILLGVVDFLIGFVGWLSNRPKSD